MKWISYRGNLYGRDESRENSCDFVWNALQEGYYVVVDVWLEGTSWMMGAQSPTHILDDTLRNHDRLWFHPMNEMTSIKISETEGKIYNKLQNIAHLPEKNMSKTCQGKKNIMAYDGILSNYIGFYKQRNDATVNIGLLIGGRFTCHDQCLIPQVINYLTTNRSHWIDVFVSINDDPEKNAHYLSSHNMLDTPFITELLCTRYYTKEHYKTYKHKKDYVRVQNCMSMYYNNLLAMNMLKNYKISNDITYDLVMKYRPDITQKNLPITVPVFVNMLKERNFTDNKNIVYTPKIHCYGYDKDINKIYEYNDQIAIGTFDVLEKYCSIFTHIEECLDREEKGYFLHPETILGYHLDKLSIKIEKFDYEYDLDDRRF